MRYTIIRKGDNSFGVISETGHCFPPVSTAILLRDVARMAITGHTIEYKHDMAAPPINIIRHSDGKPITHNG